MRAGWEYARENFEERPAVPRRAHERDAGKILIEGNAAAALGACSGASRGDLVPDHAVVVPRRVADRLPAHRIDPETGKATFAVVQAEDEIAAIGMVLGAGWAGARAMTTTSGPGISLMSEFTGSGTTPNPGGHLRHPARRPLHRPADAHRAGRHRSPAVARRHQAHPAPAGSIRSATRWHRLLRPRRAVADAGLRDDRSRPRHEQLDGRPVPVPEEPFDRGKVLAPRRCTIGEFERYRDVDGDGIPYRTLPGQFGRLLHARLRAQRGGHYTEKPDDYKNNMDRLREVRDRAHAGAAARGRPAGRREVGIIAYGISHWAVVESARPVARGNGLETRTCACAPALHGRDRGVRRAHERVYVVEQNRDGQMADLLRQEFVGLRGSPSSAACSTTTACRSTHARSPLISARTMLGVAMPPARLRPEEAKSGPRKP